MYKILQCVPTSFGHEFSKKQVSLSKSQKSKNSNKFVKFCLKTGEEVQISLQFDEISRILDFLRKSFHQKPDLHSLQGI